MLTRFAIAALDRSPWLRRVIWRHWYQRLAKKFPQASWTFMNYGYEPVDETVPLALNASDEPDRLCVQLYERALAGIALAGKHAVEIGSGRGGGASYVARQHQPERLVGVDFSKGAVKLCRRTHGEVANLSFVHGDAERLPFASSSFDVVINAESSHCYGDVDRFFAEVHRVLRSAGHFAIADFRAAAEMPELGEKLAQLPGFRLLEHEDITERVVAAMAADDARKRVLIDEIITPRLQPLFGEFAGLRGGQVFESLQSGAMLYHRFLLQKA